MKKKYLLKFNEYNIMHLTMPSEKKHYNNLNSICFRLVGEVYEISSSTKVDYEKYSCLYRIAKSFEKKILEVIEQYSIQTMIKRAYGINNSITQIMCENKLEQKQVINSIESIFLYLCLLRNELWSMAERKEEFEF